MLLVNNDQTEIGKGSEYGASGADHDAGAAETNTPPFIEPFSCAETAVQDSDIVVKASPEEPDGLRSKGDLGNQNDGFFARFQTAVDAPHIDFRFTASRYAVQQERFRVSVCNGV